LRSTSNQLSDPMLRGNENQGIESREAPYIAVEERT
jgi:hypothetical protein